MMFKRLLLTIGLGLLFAPLTPLAQSRSGTRPLAIEDYYRIQTVGSPQISPDGRWVAFSVSTRIEDDNSTRTETYLAPSDASARPRRVVHYGKDISNTAWSDDNRLRYAADRQLWSVDPSNALAVPAKASTLPVGAIASVDGKWIAVLRDKPQPKRETSYSSDFERRHEERFKGNTFDWKDFQRDGQPFPAPNLRARPASQLVVQLATGSETKVLGRYR